MDHGKKAKLRFFSFSYKFRLSRVKECPPQFQSRTSNARARNRRKAIFCENTRKKYTTSGSKEGNEVAGFYVFSQ